jgi:integrase
MAMTRAPENAKDPGTGKSLPDGVTYRGRAQYRARKLIDGVRHTKTFNTARLAREWLEETSAAVRQDAFVDRRVLTQSTLGQLISRYVEENMAAGSTRRGAAEDRTHIPPLERDRLLWDVSLSELKPSVIRSFRDRQLAAGFAPATVRKRMNLIQGILSYAIAEWDLPLKSNPASSEAVERPLEADDFRDRRLLIAKPSDVRKALQEERDLPKSEEERLFEALAISRWPHDAPLARWSIEQAMRQGESLALRWKDVDLEDLLVTVRGRHGLGTKGTKKQRKGVHEKRPLMPGAIAVLVAMKGDREPDPEDFVFDVGPVSAFRVRFGRIAKRAGLEDFTFHDLRHEATSRLAKTFPSSMDLQRVTGHRDLRSLNRYYHPDLTDLARRAQLAAAEQVAAVEVNDTSIQDADGKTTS